MIGLRSLVLHRANDLVLANLPPGFLGAEIDLRTESKRLILAHDPFIDGPCFAEWLRSFSGEFLILNVKEVGIEAAVAEEIYTYRPDLDYFFLDLPIPSLLRSLNEGFPVAARISEFESVKDALETGAPWLWVDSFTGDWSLFEQLMKVNQRTCLVSPELQGRTYIAHQDEFERIRNFLANHQNLIDMICTKSETYWNV